MNPFAVHPATVGETYWQHLHFAARFGGKMALGACAALLHALLPFVCVTTAGRINDELTQMRASVRGRTVRVVDMATMQPLDWQI